MKNSWHAFIKSFHRNETIVWSRLKVAAGLLVFAAIQSGMAPSVLGLSAHWDAIWQVLSIWIMADGSFSEWVRRHKATDLNSDDGSTGGM